MPQMHGDRVIHGMPAANAQATMIAAGVDACGRIERV
jgi:hypothetical protein